MAGLEIKVSTDEMIIPRLAVELRRQGYDVLSCQPAGRANQRLADADQFTYATSCGRAVYSFNATDFDRLDRQWNDAGWRHAGIVVSEDLNADLPELLRRLKCHLDTVDPHVQRGRYLLLSR